MTQDETALDDFLAGVDPDRVPVVVALDAAIRRAQPDFDTAVKYHLLMYALHRDWRHWVCAIDAHPKSGVGLRFLYGVLLDDPRRVLRAGSSVLMTWDLPPGQEVDPDGVGAYVTEAVARYPWYRAHEQEVLRESRAAAAARGPRARTP